MSKKIFTILVLLAILAGELPAQPVFPGDDEIYRDDVVARIDIAIHPDTLAWIYQYENLESDIEWHAMLVFNNGTIHDTIENIGFRLRGNTSRYSAKKSFKVSFNTWESGRKYHGVEKMNLNGEHNDPAVARAKFCWDLCRELEIPAPRSNHVRVYINGNYYGLYLNVEHIDEEFVDLRFGNQSGNLYKCLWPADLNYLGDNPDLYKYENGGRRAYELKTNESLDDYSDLAHFIDVLNNTPIDELECEIEKVFNVQDYMKVAAMDVFTGNWDGYIYNKNNFYLYRNAQTGKFEYIPYDLDNTFGIDWFGIDWGQRDIYAWENPGEYRPLFERLMEIQKYRDWFSWYMSQIIDEMNSPEFFDRMNAVKNLIYPYVQNDPYYPLDYGYSASDFLQAYTSFNQAHVKYGIKDYITARAASAQQQLEVFDVLPVMNYLNVTHAGPGSEVEFSVFAWDEEELPAVNLNYSVNAGEWQVLEMIPVDAHQYAAQLPTAAGETTNISFRISAEDVTGNISFYPCEPEEIQIAQGGQYPLYINEFLAGNDYGITDEAGEHEDWLEIYNDGDESIWLGDKFLSDNLSNPGKWQFPDFTIQPGEFLLVWCDEDQEQGMFHTNFKISKGGEELGIFDSEGTGFATIDSVIFAEQQDDVSFGRDPDAGAEWKFYEDPTPGISNLLSSTGENMIALEPLMVYPNPIKEGMLYLSAERSFSLFLPDGREVLARQNAGQFSVSGLMPGFYLLKTSSGETIKIIKQ